MMEKALNSVSSATSPPSSSMKDDGDRRRIDSGRPIRFVYFDQNDNLRLHSDAIDVLQRIKGPVAVVSVFGPPRQGKSFILNQVLGKSSGFPIASTHQSCTKGLWMWSEPLKRIALDGTEYDLLLFDSGGINGYDQTGMHSVKMSTLAVLLSSMFIYNQVGLIDEAALDHVSLLTEMTKHIHLRASERNDSISGFEYFIPVFIWLLRDFYLDLAEDSSRIAPHDYLKHALRPMLDGGKDDASKNQIRESIRAVFPNQECFTLVRPLNNETDLQHLDQVPLDQFRPEFQSRLEVFMKFVNERTRPKQVGGSAVTGPLLATITNFFLDVLNDSTIPTMPSSWQIHARDAFVEADSHGSEVIKSMETKLHEACQVANARLEHVAEVLESLLSEYEASIHGPMKWQKLSSFLQKSLQGLILLHAKKLIDQISSEKNSLLSKCCSDEDKIELLRKQLEASHKLRAEYQNCYDDSIKDFKKVSDQYKSRVIDLEQKYRLLEERYSTSFEMLDSAKQDSLEWERKYEGILVEKGADKEQGNAKTSVVGFGVCEEAAKIAPGAESSELALEEAREWKEKYDTIVNESKAALEKAAEQASQREEALLAKFTDNVADKDKEIKKMITKIEDSERRLSSLTSDLKAAELKIENSDSEPSALKLQIKELEKEAREWKEKYDIIVNESKATLEKTAEQARQREEALITKFTDSLAEKDEEIRKMVTKVEDSEQRLTSLTSDLKAVEIAARSLQLALKEAHGWKEKYDTIVNESNAALEKAAEQARQREEALIAKFTDSLAEKDKEIKKMVTMVEDSEQRLTSMNSDLKAVEIAAESSQRALKEARGWKEKYDSIVNESNAALEKAAEQARQREEALIAKFTESLTEKDKEIKEMITKIEDSERRLTSLTSDLKAAELKIENNDLESSTLKLQIKELAEKHWLAEASNQSTVKEIKLLEERYLSESKKIEEAQERFKVLEEETETNKNIETAQTEGFNGQTVNMETMDTGKEDLAGESPSWQLDLTQETPNFLKQELTSDNSEESTHFREPRTYSGNKRSRLEFSNPKLRKPKSRSALQKCTTAESDSSFKVEEEGETDEYQDVASSGDYTKLTVMKLRQELQEHGFGWELQKLKQPRKKDILALYRTLVLKK